MLQVPLTVDSHTSETVNVLVTASIVDKDVEIDVEVLV
jgi:hypothetical protein